MTQPKPNGTGRVVAVFICYRARATLEAFHRDFPYARVDHAILVDDASDDGSYELARSLGIDARQNPRNVGYGGNLKRALALALAGGADTIVDLHPDGEYLPSAIGPALARVAAGADLVLGNRFARGRSPRSSGMYAWKVAPLRVLNAVHRRLVGVAVHDLHQGFRVYTRRLLERVRFETYSDDYLFSFELLRDAARAGARIEEVPVVTRYRGEKRGASLRASVRYTLGTWAALARRTPQGTLAPLDQRIADLLGGEANRAR